MGAKWGYNELPTPPTYPGKKLPPRMQAAKSWENVTIDELISPQVRELLKD